MASRYQDMSDKYEAAFKELSHSQRILRALTSEGNCLTEDERRVASELLNSIEKANEARQIEDPPEDLRNTVIEHSVWLKETAEHLIEHAVLATAVPSYPLVEVADEEGGGRYRLPSVDKNPVVGAVPGGGWVIKCMAPSGDTWTDQVIVWNVQADGTLTPAALEDSSGFWYYPTLDTNLAMVKLCHPDHPDLDNPS
uniref:hypothetical protein n=1 Tax=Streptomyces tubercidicus TaxID=47759 RepID=UPI0037DD739E|nr:hypothetical protein OG690_38370 [Streptomyces tubercidicus]